MCKGESSGYTLGLVTVVERKFQLKTIEAMKSYEKEREFQVVF